MKKDYDILYETYSGIGFPKDTHALHVHEYSEISLASKGDVTYVTDEMTKHATDRFISFSRAFQYHNTYPSNTPYENQQIMFDLTILYTFLLDDIDIFSPLQSSDIIELTGKQYDELNAEFLKVKEVVSLPSTRENSVLKKLALSSLLIKYCIISKAQTKDERKYGNYIEQIIKYIQNNYDKKLTVQLLTDEFFVSRTKIFHDFKKHTGTTPNLFITDIKLHHSKEFLLSGYSVEKTAEACGFKSASHFIQTFNQHNNMTPLQFIQTFSHESLQSKNQHGYLKKKIDLQKTVDDYLK